MFGKNCLRECNTVIRSITYLIYIVALLAMFFTQYSPDVTDDMKQAQKGILFEDTRWGVTDNNLLVEPSPYAGNYGRIDAEMHTQVMRNVAYRMFRDISNNSYQTYTLGLILTDKSFDVAKQQRVKEIFKDITGESFENVQAEFYEMDLAKVLEQFNVTEDEAKDYLKNVYHQQLADEFAVNHATSLLYHYEEYMPVNETLSYEKFKSLIGEFKTMIGGKTLAYERLEDYGSIPLTYEASLARHNTFVNEDGVSGAYARLLCDYVGVVVGIVPAFIAVAIAMVEIRRKKYEMLTDDSLNTNSNGIAARFTAIVTATFIPVLLLAIISTTSLANGVEPLGLTIDNLAFIKYSIAWLLPTIMFSVAIGLFFTELTKIPVGILVQLVIWFCSVWLWTDHGLSPIKYGANMFIRHNVVGEYQIYLNSFYEIMINRISYTAAAILLVFAATYIRKKFNNKRLMEC